MNSQYETLLNLLQAKWDEAVLQNQKETEMPTKKTAPIASTATFDPLAGIPTATAKAAKTAPAAPAAPATGGTIINLASAKKKRKLSGQAYKDARDFARGVTGYNDTSPIWGKRLNTVLTDVEADLEAAVDAIQTGNTTTPRGELDEVIERALHLNRELQKRVATGQLIGAQS